MASCNYVLGLLFLVLSSAEAFRGFGLDVEEEYPNVPNCGLTALDTHVVAGSHSFIGEDPWIALLIFRDINTKKTEYTCTGAIINYRYVITAAHCLQDAFLAKNKLYHVRLGEHNISSPHEEFLGQTFNYHDFEVESFVIHPQFNDDSFYSNDIALIRLTQNVNFDLYLGQINAICIPPRDYEAIPGHFAMEQFYRIVGWNFGAGNPSDTLMVSYVEIVDNDRCTKVYRGRIADLKLCVSPKGRECVGDSGSPLVTNEYQTRRRLLLGVLSITVPRICFKYPSLYTSVHHYVDWLIENTR